MSRTGMTKFQIGMLWLLWTFEHTQPEGEIARRPPLLAAAAAFFFSRGRHYGAQWRSGGWLGRRCGCARRDLLWALIIACVFSGLFEGAATARDGRVEG